MKRESPPGMLEYETRRARPSGPTGDRLTALEIVFATCGVIAILTVAVGALAAYCISRFR